MTVLATLVARGGVSNREDSIFRAVNGASDSWRIPMIALMQAGNFATVWTAAGVLKRDRRRVIASGTGAWIACKVIKKFIRRGRPETEIGDVHIRGGRQRGLGFPSGHAAVAFALATVTAPRLDPRVRTFPYALAGLVAVARVYVGAHLPADVLGGAGVGIAAGSMARELVRSAGNE